MSDVVLYERRGPAAWVTLNRPSKLNAISGEVVRRLRESWREAAEDEDVKVVVLTGAGGPSRPGTTSPRRSSSRSRAPSAGTRSSPRTST